MRTNFKSVIDLKFKENMLVKQYFPAIHCDSLPQKANRKWTSRDLWCARNKDKNQNGWTQPSLNLCSINKRVLLWAVLGQVVHQI